MANVLNLVELTVPLTAGSVTLYNALARVRVVRVQPYNAAPDQAPEAAS